MISISTKTLDEFARKRGLELFAALSAKAAKQALEQGSRKLHDWQVSEYSAEMEYMRRPPELFHSLDRFLPNCRSIICFVIPYLQETPHSSSSEEIRSNYFVPPPPLGYGRVARYAWGRDYHKVIPKMMKELLADLMHHFGSEEIHYRQFSDAVPLLERVLSARSSLGFLGKNTMLIRPGVGSFSFLAEILWDVEIEDLSEEEDTSPIEAGSGCGRCQRCMNACPTKAFPGPGVLDARRCISYLTIEKRSAFSDWEFESVGDWLFGCDICQEVCPFNHRGVQATKSKEFLARPSQAPYISVMELLNISGAEEFLARFQGTAIMRAGWAQMQRNACAVAANTSFREALPRIEWLSKNSESILVRKASLLALARL